MPTFETLDEALSAQNGCGKKPLREPLLLHLNGLAQEGERVAAANYLEKSAATRLDEERLETFLPQSQYPDHWDDATRAAFEREWNRGDLKAQVRNAMGSQQQNLVAAWQVVCKMFQCLPTDLISPRRGRRLLYGGTGGVDRRNGLVGDGIEIGRGARAQPDTIWRPRFLNALVATVCCHLWENNPDVWVMAVQYVIICKTGDRRKWLIGDGDGDPTGTDFVKALMAAIEAKGQDETIKDAHRRVLRENPRMSRSIYSQLFRRIESRLCGTKSDPRTNGRFYWVTAKDLEDLEVVANTSGGRRFATGNLNARLIKQAMGHSPPSYRELEEYLLRGSRQLLIDVWVNEEDPVDVRQDEPADEAGDARQAEDGQGDVDDDPFASPPRRRRQGRPRRREASRDRSSHRSPRRRELRGRRQVVVDNDDEDSSPRRPVRRRRQVVVADGDDEEDSPPRPVRRQRTRVDESEMDDEMDDDWRDDDRMDEDDADDWRDDDEVDDGGMDTFLFSPDEEMQDAPGGPEGNARAGAASPAAESRAVGATGEGETGGSAAQDTAAGESVAAAAAAADGPVSAGSAAAAGSGMSPPEAGGPNLAAFHLEHPAFAMAGVEEWTDDYGEAEDLPGIGVPQRYPARHTVLRMNLTANTQGRMRRLV